MFYEENHHQKNSRNISKYFDSFYGLNSMDKVTKLFKKYIDDLSDISSVN